MTANKTKSVSSFVNPAGFFEQHYVGAQTKLTVNRGVKLIEKNVLKFKEQGKVPLVLVDLSQVTTTDPGSHMAAVRGMRKVPYERVAIYGPFSMQVLLNTLALVADKSDSVRAFSNRTEALAWLKQGGRS